MNSKEDKDKTNQQSFKYNINAAVYYFFIIIIVLKYFLSKCVKNFKLTEEKKMLFLLKYYFVTIIKVLVCARY